MPLCPACQNEIAHSDRNCPFCGRAVGAAAAVGQATPPGAHVAATVDQATVDRLRQLLADDQRDAATELLVETTGLGHESAGAALDSLVSGQMTTVTTSTKVNVDATTWAEVQRLAQAGQKIQAIKVLRDATGLGLAESKAVVDKLCPTGSSVKVGCTGALFGWLW